MMPPLHIEIMLHYNCDASDYRKGDFSAPAVKSAIEKLHNFCLLDRSIKLDKKYKITNKGRAYVRFLCQVPVPVTTWVLPKNTK